VCAPFWQRTGAMAWVSVMSRYWWALARLEHFRKTRPGRYIVHVTRAIVYAAEDGDPKLARFLDEVLDAFEWDPIKPKSVTRNEGYQPYMIVAGACIALMAGDKRAKPYLRELATVFGATRKLELKAVAKLARAVDTGRWEGDATWNELPLKRLPRTIRGRCHHRGFDRYRWKSARS
jgi:hypothetical protein